MSTIEGASEVHVLKLLDDHGWRSLGSSGVSSGGLGILGFSRVSGGDCLNHIRSKLLI